jgi:glutamate-1-semialdehyde 2,1-aminomutase
MAAGVVALGEVYTPPVAVALNARGDALREELNAVCAAARAPFQWTGLGSLMQVHCTRGPLPLSGVDEHADRALQELLFFDLLRAGIYMARRGFIALSLSIGDAECAKLLAVVQQFLVERRSLFPAEAP